jgi:hypothetical protein
MFTPGKMNTVPQALAGLLYALPRIVGCVLESSWTSAKTQALSSEKADIWFADAREKSALKQTPIANG